MNNADFIGACLNQPQLRYSQDNQTPIAEFLMAVPNPKKDEPPCQYPVIAWGKAAEAVNTHVKPGMELKVQGSIRIDTVENPDGTKDKVATIQARYVNSLQTIFDATTALANATPAPQPPPVAPPAPVAAGVGSAVAPQPPGYTAAPGGGDPYSDIPF